MGKAFCGCSLFPDQGYKLQGQQCQHPHSRSQSHWTTKQPKFLRLKEVVVPQTHNYLHKEHTALTGMKRPQGGKVQGWNPKHGELNTAAQQDRHKLKHLQGHSHWSNNEKNEKHYDSESNLLPTPENSFLFTSFFTLDKKQACVFRILQCWLPHSDTDYSNQRRRVLAFFLRFVLYRAASWKLMQLVKAGS